MSSDTFFKTAEFYTLKGAQRDLIKLAGGIDRAALISGLSTSQIGRFNNRELADLMPLHIVVKLEADVREPVVSRAMVLLAGGDVSVPNEETPRASLMSSFVEITAEHAEVCKAVAEAISDGEWSPAECWVLLPKLTDLRHGVDHMLAAAHRKLAGSPLKSMAGA